MLPDSVFSGGISQGLALFWCRVPGPIHERHGLCRVRSGCRTLESARLLRVQGVGAVACPCGEGHCLSLPHRLLCWAVLCLQVWGLMHLDCFPYVCSPQALNEFLFSVGGVTYLCLGQLGSELEFCR